VAVTCAARGRRVSDSYRSSRRPGSLLIGWRLDGVPLELLFPAAQMEIKERWLAERVESTLTLRPSRVEDGGLLSCHTPHAASATVPLTVVAGTVHGLGDAASLPTLPPPPISPPPPVSPLPPRDASRTEVRGDAPVLAGKPPENPASSSAVRAAPPFMLILLTCKLLYIDVSHEFSTSVYTMRFLY